MAERQALACHHYHANIVVCQLVETFGSTRDDWMAEDMQGWLQSNGIYEPTPQVLRHLMADDEVYIVTTKQVSPP